MLMNKVNYHDAMYQSFSGKTKSKIIKNVPTLTRIKTAQNYLNSFCKRNEIIEAKMKQMRQMSVQLHCAHGSSKIHMVCANIPKFHPISDTTKTPYYKIGQYQSSLLHLLPINNYTIKDYFNEANKFVSSEMFEEEYQFVSFYVESLLTNVPLSKTININ